jgi:hypothetical protein
MDTEFQKASTYSILEQTRVLYKTGRLSTGEEEEGDDDDDDDDDNDENNKNNTLWHCGMTTEGI